MKKIVLLIFLVAMAASVYAADVKITALPEATSISSDDLFMMVDSPSGSAATKKITVTNLFADIPVSLGVQASTTTGGYIRFKEGSNNGTDYSQIQGAADAGTYPSFTFGGSQGSEDAVFTASSNLWTWSSTTSATFAFTPAVALNGGATIATYLNIPNGSSPTVDAAGEIAIDTTSDQLVYYGGAKRVLPYKQFLSFTIAAPADTDDINLLKAPYGMTILAINCIVQGTTSVTGQLQECDSTGGSCADLDSDITCDADGAADDGTLTDSAIASAGWLRWKTTSVSGTPTFLTVTVTYSVVSD